MGNYMKENVVNFSITPSEDFGTDSNLSLRIGLIWI